MMVWVRATATVLVMGLVTWSFAAEKFYSGEPIKVLHVTGGGGHDYMSQSKIVSRLITMRGDFKIDVIGPKGDAAKKILSKDGWADGYDNDILPTVTALAMGDNRNAKQGSQVCVWINKCKNSKVFGTSLGHHDTTLEQKIYGDLLVRGLLWACDKL